VVTIIYQGSDMGSMQRSDSNAFAYHADSEDIEKYRRAVLTPFSVCEIGGAT